MGNKKLFSDGSLDFDAAETVKKLDKNADDALRDFAKGKINL